MNVNENLNKTYDEETYLKAVEYFNRQITDDINFSIENENTRECVDELCYCYLNNMSILDFDAWIHFESLLGEKLTYEEYSTLNEAYKDDPFEIELNDEATIQALFSYLSAFRNNENLNEKPALDDLITQAQRAKSETDNAKTTEIYTALYKKYKVKFHNTSKDLEDNYSGKDILKCAEEYVAQKHMVQFLKENIDSKVMPLYVAEFLLEDKFTVSLAEVYEHLQKLQNPAQLKDEFHMDICNAFETCVDHRLEFMSQMVENAKKIEPDKMR